MSYASLDNLRLPSKPLHLAVGMFDGVHLGHQAVIESAIHSARRTGGIAGVLTFWPHPSKLFRPEEATRLLMPLEAKEIFLNELGVSCVIAQEFTREFAAIEAKDFPAYLKERLPTLSAIYVGENFRFGKGRNGDAEQLVEYSRACGLHVVSAERIKFDGEPISSTRIRACLSAGEIAQANALLGYAYGFTGAVVPGRQLGRELGFPTLNFHWEPELKPRYGVYAVRVREVGGEWLNAVANYGLRPSITEAVKHPLLEVHLLAPTRLGPGAVLQVEWLHFLREEKKFDDLGDLKAQIGQDRDGAEAYFRQA